MYPIIFKSIYFEKVWGGRLLESINRKLPKGSIGESFDISSNDYCENMALNGVLKGKTIREIYEIYGEEFLGTNISIDNFPILVKIISASDNLSVQVHPDDDFARANENCTGKTEAWYILDANEDSEIVLGTKRCSGEEFLKAIRNNNINEYLNFIKVKKGDFFFVKSGTIHAIGRGIILLEVQQDSDLTYRVYDYNRGRELHIEKAIKVIDFKKIKKINIKKEVYKGNVKEILSENDYFTMEKYIIKNKIDLISSKEHFNIITCVLGEGKIIYKEGYENIKIGESYLIPASLGRYSIRGNVIIVNSYPIGINKPWTI